MEHCLQHRWLALLQWQINSSDAMRRCFVVVGREDVHISEYYDVGRCHNVVHCHHYMRGNWSGPYVGLQTGKHSRIYPWLLEKRVSLFDASLIVSKKGERKKGVSPQSSTWQVSRQRKPFHYSNFSDTAFLFSFVFISRALTNPSHSSSFPVVLNNFVNQQWHFQTKLVSFGLENHVMAFHVVFFSRLFLVSSLPSPPSRAS
jgi:hypothetical protein